MDDIERAKLRRLPLFREMQTQTFDSLMDVAKSHSFPADHELIRQGETGEFLHIIVSGTAELYASWKGRRTVLGAVQPVSAFILAASVCDAPYLMSARTVERSRIIEIPNADVRVALRRDPDFSMAMMRELAEGYRGFVRQSKNLKLRSSVERLAAFLLHLSDRHEGSATFPLPTEKRHLASYLGMTPEYFSRSIKFLSGKGVTIRGNGVVINDRLTLTSVAFPDQLMDGRN